MWSPVLEPPVAGQPDRRKLFYQSKSGGNFDIYSVIIDYDTNRSYLDAPPVRLTNSPGRDLRPAVSPDGTRIVFYSDRTGNNEIFRMDVDGTNLVQLTDNDSSEHTPTWGN